MELFPSLPFSGSTTVTAAVGSITSTPAASAKTTRVSQRLKGQVRPQRRLTSDLLDRPSEPLPRTDDPESETVRDDDTHSDDGVVERLRIDGVLLGEDERDGDEADPEHRRGRDGQRERAEVERPADEARRVDDAERDRDAVRDVQADRRDARRRGEGDGAAEAGQAQDEAERAGEPDLWKARQGLDRCRLGVGRSVPVRMGDLRLTSTLWKNVCPGIPPSRANAYIIRLLDVIENAPHQNIEPMTITYPAPVHAQFPEHRDSRRR